MLTHEQRKKAIEYVSRLVSDRPGTYQYHELVHQLRSYMEIGGGNFGIFPAFTVIAELADAGKIRVEKRRYHPVD
ncbi:MAG: hypothetical protein HYT73_04175 [Candidatus Aenigmarchaeota archaeon]|nr:hypothetical protein [Candidatus Aenigmarchaeota archaeon]